jgi:hypothetical protein
MLSVYFGAPLRFLIYTILLIKIIIIIIIREQRNLVGPLPNRIISLSFEVPIEGTFY